MFRDRQEAGRKLVKQLNNLAIGQSSNNIVVLAIPRGGVVIGKILSQKLGCLLGTLVVKKIGAPGNPELAVGAVGPNGVAVWNQDVLNQLRFSPPQLALEISNLKLGIKERIKKFGKIPKVNLKNKTVILTDDGIATGATIEAATLWLRIQKPAKIILAIPVAPPETVEKLKELVDELVVLETPAFFGAVGQFYEEFPQVSDEEVVKLLT